MADANFPLICHWGGELREDQEGVHYSGGQRRIVVITRAMTFVDLLSKVYQALHFDKKVVDLKLKMKFPIPGSFLAMPLDDNESLLGMWSGVEQISAPSMEIYVEQFPLPACVQTRTVVTNNQSQLDQTGEYSYPLPIERGTSSSPVPLRYFSSSCFTPTLNLVNEGQDRAYLSNQSASVEDALSDEDLNVSEDNDKCGSQNTTALSPNSAQENDIAPQSCDSYRTSSATNASIGCREQMPVSQGTMIDPGPLDRSVLRLQDTHRSEDVWLGQEDAILSCREHFSTLVDLAMDDRVLHYVKLAGFYGVHRLVSRLLLDRPLITALVERWRQETHTFHLAIGEATITLQDVAVLTGLRVHGLPVTGPSSYDWALEVERLLGLRPEPKRDIRGSSLKLTWIRRHFSTLPVGADDKIVQQHARAYILLLMGAGLFADKSGGDIQLLYLPLLETLDGDHGASQYSWGSATLAYLYRQLCRASCRGVVEFSGFLLLLQLWSWEHIHIGRPSILHPRKSSGAGQHCEQPDQLGPQPLSPQYQHGLDPLGRKWLMVRLRLSRADSGSRLAYYRDALDAQSPDQMTWQPYTRDILEALPDICRADQQIWRTKAPLICFDIVECYFPDRVLRQFGLQQAVPIPCDTSDALHKIDRRGRFTRDWSTEHILHVSQWNRREDLVVSDDLPACSSGTPYLVWYRRITRLFISPSFRPPTTSCQTTSTSIHEMTHALQDIHEKGTRLLSRAGDPSIDGQSWSDVVSLCKNALRTVGEVHLVEEPHTTSPSPSAPPPISRAPPSDTPLVTPLFQAQSRGHQTVNLSPHPIPPTQRARQPKHLISRIKKRRK